MSGAAQRPARRDWRDLRTRLISAAVILPVATLCIWAGGVAFDLMILLATVGMVYEGATVMGQSWRAGPGLWRAILLLAWPAASILAASQREWRAALAMIGTGFVFGAERWALLWVVLSGSLALMWLRHFPGWGTASILFVIAVVVASDSCAYLAGRIFGGPKLAPHISPGKTRSGALGGLLGAVCTGGLAAALSAPGTAAGGLAYGAVLGLAAQAGDLAESAFKRRYGVKDSGRLIPGHGGLLDRFDALLAAAALAALLSFAVSGRPFWTASPRDLVGALLGGPAGLQALNRSSSS